MANLNFTLSGRSDGGLNQAWEIRSVHTDVLIGDVIWRPSWSMYSFEPAAQPPLRVYNHRYLNRDKKRFFYLKSSRDWSRSYIPTARHRR